MFFFASKKRSLGGSIILVRSAWPYCDFEVSHAYFGGDAIVEDCCFFESQTYAAAPAAMKIEREATVIFFDMLLMILLASLESFVFLPHCLCGEKQRNNLRY